MNDLRNFNEIFRKDVTYDNIKSHKKSWFHPLCRRYVFGKTTDVGQITPPAPVPPRFFMIKVVLRTHCFRTLNCSKNLSKFNSPTSTTPIPSSGVYHHQVIYKPNNRFK